MKCLIWIKNDFAFLKYIRFLISYELLNSRTWSVTIDNAIYGLLVNSISSIIWISNNQRKKLGRRSQKKSFEKNSKFGETETSFSLIFKQNVLIITEYTAKIAWKNLNGLKTYTQGGDVNTKNLCWNQKYKNYWPRDCHLINFEELPLTLTFCD